MAGRIIEVDTVELRRDQQVIHDKLIAIQTALKQVYDEVAELDTMWDGAANEAFNKQFAADKEAFEEVCAQVQSLLENLDYAQTQYDQCENQVHAAVAAIRI